MVLPCPRPLANFGIPTQQEKSRPGAGRDTIVFSSFNAHGPFKIVTRGNGPSRRPLEIQKKQSVLNIPRHYCWNGIKFTGPKNIRRDTHKTQKPLFPQLETAETSFFWNLCISSELLFSACQKRNFKLGKRLLQAENIYESE